MSRRPRRRRLLAHVVALVALVLVSACDLRGALPPDPAAIAVADDQRRAALLRAHLEALPLVTGASVVLDRAPPDPLARTPHHAPPAVAIALVAPVDIDTARLDALARTAARALLGADARISVAILPAPDRPALARLGPFTVAATARAPLLALIAGALVLIAALALALTLLLARRSPPTRD